MALQAVYTVAGRGGGEFLATGAVLHGVEGRLPAGPAAVHFASASAGVSLTVNENCDSTVQSDLRGALRRFSQPAATAAGRAAVAQSLVGLGIWVLFQDRRSLLGTWQGIYVADWREAANRSDVITIVATVFPGTQAGAAHCTPPGRSGQLVTADIEQTVNDRGGGERGFVAALVRHSSASLALCHNAAEATPKMEQTLNAAVPEAWNREFFEHTYEGSDDMPAHAKCTIVGPSLAVPFGFAQPKKLDLTGGDRGIVLCEHRNHGGWGGGGRKIATVAVSHSAAFASAQCIAVAASQSHTAIGPLIGEFVAAKCNETGKTAGIVLVASETPLTSIVSAECSVAAEVATILTSRLLHVPSAQHNYGCEANVVGTSKAFPITNGALNIPTASDVYVLCHGPTHIAQISLQFTVYLF